MNKLGILVMLMTLSLVGIAYAGTCTFANPPASGIIQANYIFNISLSVETNNNQTVHNCSVAASSVSSGDSFSFFAINDTTAAASSQHANKTVITTNYKDATDWTFTATCTNLSNAVTIDTCTLSGITIDNRVPICTTTDLGSKTYSPKATFTATCTNSTQAYIQFGGNADLAMTKSGNTCTFTGNGNNVPEGTYDSVIYTMTDGTNTTTCSISNVKIDTDSTAKLATVAVGLSAQAGAKAAEATSQTTGKNNMLLIGGAVVLAIWYFGKKKK